MAEGRQTWGEHGAQLLVTMDAAMDRLNRSNVALEVRDALNAQAELVRHLKTSTSLLDNSQVHMRERLSALDGRPNSLEEMEARERETAEPSNIESQDETAQRRQCER